MMSDNARSIVLVFDESHTRIQSVSELLLISCTPRPVFTHPEDLTLTGETFVRYRDKVISQLNRMLILSRDIATQVHGKQIHWKPFCQRVQELTTAVIHLSELSAHIAYLMALNTAGSEAAMTSSVANVHQLMQADLDIKFSCTRLKRSRMNDLHPHVLVDLCSTLTKSLTTMTDICRQAAEKILDVNDQDQFKLCVKAITSTTGCLVSSIKSFKHSPTEVHMGRVVTFCDPVTSASAALLGFATEETFSGTPAVLSEEGSELYKSILGLAMSIASANIQICRAVRDLVYSSSTKRHQDRLSLCVESVTRSSSQLRDLLLSYEFSSIGSSEQDENIRLLSSTLKTQQEKGDDTKLGRDTGYQGFSQMLHNTGQSDFFKDGNFCKTTGSTESDESKTKKGKKEGSKSPKSGKERKSKSPKQSRKTSKSGEVVTTSKTGEGGKLDVYLKEYQDDNKNSKSSSSRPSSMVVDAALAPLSALTATDDQKRLSPSTFLSESLSSPLSISSSSLASTSSFSLDPSCIVDGESTLPESTESMLVLERLDKEEKGEQDKGCEKEETEVYEL